MLKSFKKSKALFAFTLAVLLILTAVSSFSVMAGEEPSSEAAAENIAVEDGVYLIENMKFNPEVQDHEVMDVRDSSKDAGIDIILNDKSGSESEKFQFTKVDENVYNIQNVNSGLYLSVDPEFGEFPTLVQGDKKGSFSFEKVKDDWIMIKDNDTGVYLKVDDTQHKAVRPILTAEKSDSLYLKWRLLDPDSVQSSADDSTQLSSEGISSASQTADTNTSSGSSPTLWIIIGAAALVIAVGAVIIVLVTKSKEK